MNSESFEIVKDIFKIDVANIIDSYIDLPSIAEILELIGVETHDEDTGDIKSVEDLFDNDFKLFVSAINNINNRLNHCKIIATLKQHHDDFYNFYQLRCVDRFIFDINYYTTYHDYYRISEGHLDFQVWRSSDFKPEYVRDEDAENSIHFMLNVCDNDLTKFTKYVQQFFE